MSHSKPFKSDDIRHMEALHAELELKALEAQELMGDPTWRRVLRGLLANRASLAGTIILIFFAALATLAPILAPCPDDPRQQRRCGESSPNGPYGVPQYGYSTEPQPPSAEFRFGTTPKQYDIYYATVWGSRTAFKVGIVIVGLSLLMGLTWGSVSAYYGGWIDEIMMRVVEIFQAFPFLLAAITLATVLQARPEIGGILPAMVAITAFSWMGYARLIRADILSVKQREYVWAARSVGASDLRIITRHILPNTIFPVLVLASLDIGTIVLTFAALSFFGLGVPDGYADWGQMIASARARVPSLAKDWYIVVYPGLSIMLFSLSWNLIGDAFRDLLDPRLAK